MLFSNYNKKLLGDKFYYGKCFIRVIVFWHHSCPDFYRDFWQWDINTLQEWANCWKMKFNPIKCAHEF